jgi:hypothetical protein
MPKNTSMRNEPSAIGPNCSNKDIVMTLGWTVRRVVADLGQLA